MKISGPVATWNVNADRKYSMAFAKYKDIRPFLKIDVFDVKSGEGEQRDPKSHSRTLARDIAEGNFTPTAFYFGTRSEHRKDLVVAKDTFELELKSEAPLPVLDAGGRLTALDSLHKKGGDVAKLIEDLTIPYLILLDGNTKMDFINYQKGASPSRDMILSLQNAVGAVDQKHAPFTRIALEVAQLLNDDSEHFLYKQIRFDQSTSDKFPFSIKSLCTTSAGDVGVSLYGGAKIAVSHNKDAEWLAGVYHDAYQALLEQEDAVRLLDRGNVLSLHTPYINGVSKVSKLGSGLLIGMSNVLAERLGIQEGEETVMETLELWVDVALNTFENELAEDYTKRNSKSVLLGKFSQGLFEDIILEQNEVEDKEDPDLKLVGHCGVPITTIQKLSASAFGLAPLPKNPKEKKKPGRKPKLAVPQEEDLDDLIEPLPDPDAEHFKELDEQGKVHRAKLEQEAESEQSESPEALNQIIEVEETSPWNLD